MLDAVRALLTPQSSTVLLSDAQEWGFTIGFFLLLVFAAYFLVKVATGDFDDLELPCWPARKKRSAFSLRRPMEVQLVHA